MSSKRGASGDGSEPPSKKKAFLLSQTAVNLGPISTEEELDLKVVKIQNAKLYSKLEEKNAQEEESKVRFAKLERLRNNDQNIISSMNVAWNQLDQDVNNLLKRFGDVSEDEALAMSETTVAFLEKLSNRTTKGTSEEIQKRVTHSSSIIERLVVRIEKNMKRNKELIETLKNDKKEEKKSLGEKKVEGDQNDFEDERNDISSTELELRQELSLTKSENLKLHDSMTSLQDKYRTMSTEYSEMKDRLATMQKENAELKAKQEDMEYDLQRATKQFEKLIKKLNETHEQGSKSSGGSSAVSGSSQQAVSSGGGGGHVKLVKDTPEDIKAEMDAKDELANNRLEELKKLQELYQNLHVEHDKLKQQLMQLPDEVIINHTKYKMLQTQFNLCYNDAQEIRRHCEEARKIVVNNRSQHIQQQEHYEMEIQTQRKKVRAEISQLERALAESRKDLELLRVEYEHNMKAHEQIGPMAKEMRHLINSLQNHNQQLKGEVSRYKKKLTDVEKKLGDIDKTKSPDKERDISDYIDLIDAPNAPTSASSSRRSESSHSSDEGDYDDVKMLRTKLKVAREKRKEMKLLLDMYKGVSKETRDKVELLKNEKTLKDEVEIMKCKLAVVTEDVVAQSKKFSDEDHLKECKKLEAKNDELKKTINNMKQEGDALLGEMEFTGQAFEEMQDQNIQLMQQLREKDDANLKLMSERIKSTQIQKLLREEKEVLLEKISALTSRQSSIDDLVKRYEEREKSLQSTLTVLEKENLLRQQAGECHKRKAVEIGTQCQEMAFRNETLSKQCDELTKSTQDRGNRLEEEIFKFNRIQEENIGLKKKLDKAKRMEYLGASDEILVEEVKMYKSKLMCPICNTRPKDAILTKCFHVFCIDCLKTRYDTRQRKCPKCNATFGNNDFHKMYM
ncbi:E3 ubiquitin-protein ligase Bre1-like [Clytia hemisphaerica]|uniref:E3 ubiquitin protein ligase n=1 Tax=Clytia hemisphaerica TaxID=252671 RepID=A0A7M5USP4_9CNID